MPPRSQRTDSAGRPLATPDPYNPLEKDELARTVEAALLNKQLQRLGAVPEFLGAGIYALYYDGTHDLYQTIAGTKTPIYVGKAVPSGGRTARNDPSTTGEELWERIAKHRESIGYAEDLDPADFRVHYLITEELFIALAERMMIRTLRPVWNRVVDGFGNNDPGSGRYNQKVSRWDTLHPGRPWVRLMPNPCRYTREQILAMVAAHFTTSPQITADVHLPPAVPEPLALFDISDEQEIEDPEE